MRLRDFYDQYMAGKGSNDTFAVYMAYETDRGRTITERIDTYQLRRTNPERFDLLLEADTIETRIDEAEYTNIDLAGRSCGGGKCRVWHAEIDGDQGRIALGTHPALKDKPANKRRKRR